MDNSEQRLEHKHLNRLRATQESLQNNLETSKAHSDADATAQKITTHIEELLAINGSLIEIAEKRVARLAGVDHGTKRDQ